MAITKGFTTQVALFSLLVAINGPDCADAREVTFSDLTLSENSSWVGPDESGTDVPGPSGTTVRVGQFESNGVIFHNRFNLDWQSWGGIGYSSATDNTTPGFLNDRSAITGAGAGDAIYGLSFGYLDSVDPNDVSQLQQLPGFELPAGEQIVDMQVTNTTYAALSMRDGDAFAKKFGGASGTEPDFFRLTAYGIDANGELSGQAELYLADFRSVDDSQDYIADEWMTFDLTSLSDATRVHFNLASSDVGQFGMNTPSYFAFDTIRTVPEPGAASSMLSALALLSLWRRRQEMLATRI